jgi:hypothetical protein
MVASRLRSPRNQSPSLVAAVEGWMPAVQPCLADSPRAPEAWPDPLALVLREGA